MGFDTSGGKGKPIRTFDEKMEKELGNKFAKYVEYDRQDEFMDELLDYIEPLWQKAKKKK